MEKRPKVGTGIINSADATTDSGIAVIELELQFTEAQQLRLNENTNYLIAVLCVDTGLDNDVSDRVNLIADTTTFDLSADIPDLFGCSYVDIYEHNESY